MSNSTKDRILNTAIRLFNERGMAAVSLREIAAEVGISPGNLAYHFKNQDALIEEAFHRMQAERDAILSGVQQIPSFENINEQIPPLLDIAQRYRFLHLDTVHLFRTYPEIAELQRSYFENSIAYVRAVIDHSVGAGTFRPEPRAGQYQRLAHTVWMLMTFWLEQQAVRGRKQLDVESVRQTIWDLVLPNLTEKGKKQIKGVYARFPVH